MRTGYGIVAAAALAAGSAAQAQVLNEEEIDAATDRVTEICGAYVIETLPPDEQVRYMTCMQREAVAAFQPRLPLRIDEFTTYTAITANGTIVTYRVRIEAPRAQLAENAAQLLTDATRTNVCSATDMSATIRRGGGYRYVWSDVNGELVGETTIDRC